MLFKAIVFYRAWGLIFLHYRKPCSVLYPGSQSNRMLGMSSLDNKTMFLSVFLSSYAISEAKRRRVLELNYFRNFSVNPDAIKRKAKTIAISTMLEVNKLYVVIDDNVGILIIFLELGFRTMVDLRYSKYKVKSGIYAK